MKKETLEEASERMAKEHCSIRVNSNTTEFQIQQFIIKGAKWQQERSYSGEEPDYEKIKQALVEMRKVPMTFVPDERMYSEEEVLELLLNCRGENPINIEQWFEQAKKNI